MEKQYRSYKVPKRNWIHRNPRLFSILFMTGSMLTLFSRPLYDIFIREDFLPPPDKKIK